MTEPGHHPFAFTPKSAKAVCFDLSGTTVAWDRAFEDAFREALGEWLGRWDDGSDKEAMLDEALARYKQRRKAGKSSRDSLAASVGALPMEADRQTLTRLARSIRALQPKRATFKRGAEQSLTELAARYRIAFVTNLDAARARDVWQTLRLGRFAKEADLYAAGGDSIRKPQPALFRSVAARLGVPPNRCVMVGSSYRQDIAGAVQSGWKTVWIRGGKAARSPARTGPDAPHPSVIAIASIGKLPALFHR